MTDPAILILGATGNTGAPLVETLARTPGLALRTATRAAQAPTRLPHVRFDWNDPATFASALRGITRIYLVAPAGNSKPESLVEPFLDEALNAGTERIVLLSSSAVTDSDPGLGAIHAMVRERSPQWEILRPSWFMQNFVGDHPHAESIRNTDGFATAAEDGRLAFIDAVDIASVAAGLLTRQEPLMAEHVLTGPEALTYTEVADILAQVLGKPVNHEKVTPDRLTEKLVSAGYDPAFACLLAHLDTLVASGAQAAVTDHVSKVTGTKPRDMRSFLTANRGLLAARPHEEK